MTRTPDFDELVGADLSQSESERLRRVHDLLVAVGPPPELSPELASAPDPNAPRESRVIGLPRRGAGRLLAIAAVVAAAALVLGYVGGRRSGSDYRSTMTVRMHATAAAPDASAVIEVGELDSGGNWPLRVETRGLRELPHGAWYELYLSRNGKPVATCGAFRVHPGTTVVRLNAPYDFRRFDGWVVTEHRAGTRKRTRVLTQSFA